MELDDAQKTDTDREEWDGSKSDWMLSNLRLPQVEHTRRETRNRFHSLPRLCASSLYPKIRYLSLIRLTQINFNLYTVVGEQDMKKLHVS